MSQTKLPTIFDHLEAFKRAQDPGPLGVPDTHFHRGSGALSKTIVIGVAIHGNEFGTLPAALRLMGDLASGELKSQQDVYLILGNRKAAEMNVRFVEEDLNRVFLFDRPAESLERKRAVLLRPILEAADVFLDIHQTQTPTASAFYTFPYLSELALYARALAAAEVGLTRKAGQSFSQGMRCLDEFVRDRGKVGFTVEVGYRGLDSAQEKRAYQAMRRLIEIENAQAEGTSLQELAEARDPITYYCTQQVESDVSDLTFLRPGLSNFCPVSAGQLLSPEPGDYFSWEGFKERRYSGDELRAKHDGVLLFPKYPTDGVTMPKEIFRVAAPIANPEELLAD